MQQTNDFFLQAERCIKSVFNEVRPSLLQSFGKIAHTTKSDSSIVTALDLMVESRLREALAQFDVSIGFGGEETGVDYNQKIFWLVDPIDGTEQFSRGISGSMNVVTLISDGQPIMCVVYDFIDDKLYEARKGFGATCNGYKIQTSTRPLNRAWVSFSHHKGHPDDSFRQRLDDACTLLSTLQSGPIVASGKIEGYIVANGHGGPWDYAPRILLIQEAGGLVKNLEGADYDYRNPNFIATSPVIFEDIMRLIAVES
jgi:myo-inositol-1(or 4)-monophosphatase